ncbi:hypothetical protein A11A3_03164 [Alcanivorax hongdengensis A-11-3]|uniref:Uncharacterized protein n=1 Tax=Alcanivorax hongdengensis A-11-3 TaxID=1177179 RepID=L0WER0_9GAMM|nr:DUF6776 family protein [Alcanivorax hongdengensis]EKF75323.1 hypothetical protein A11A3_03164 [Alcanivorax hongdengensis A-11-3]
MAAKPRSRTGIDDVTLVPVSPSEQKRRRIRNAIILLVLAVLLFAGGLWLGAGGALDASEHNQRLRNQVHELQEELDKARNQLAVYRTDAQVNKQAGEQVRDQLKTLRDQVAELEEAVAFYKNVMAPGDQETGLRIEKMDVQPDGSGDGYTYKLVLVQAGDNRNRRYLSGDVTLRLVGSTADGKPVSYTGSQWLDDESETRFQFRYFQELSGHFRVPEGVAVKAIDVEAETSGRQRSRAEKTLKWQ